MRDNLIVMDFPREEKYAGDEDVVSVTINGVVTPLVARETPAYKVLERREQIQRRRKELILHAGLYPDQGPLPALPPKRGIARWLEIIGVEICLAFHLPPEYVQGELYSVCVCGRKYAVPWLRSNHPTIKPMFTQHLDPDVYIREDDFVIPTKTTQALCMNGSSGLV